MEYAKLGDTDIRVSRICVGGMSFGESSEEFHQWTLGLDATKDVIGLCFDNGVNFIDTANVYSHGTSERFIGQALRDLEIPREDVVLASKVYFNEGKLSREAILREIDGTLERLGTDYLDLYQIHRFDYGTPIEETMGTLNELVESGKVRAIGASAMYGYQFHNMQIVAEKNGWRLFSTMQNHYNLLYREDERELIPVCRQYGVSLIPYSPLAGGHLTHTGWTSESMRSSTDKVLKDKYDRAKDNDLQIIGRVHELSERYGVSMSQISLAWHFAKGVTAPIVGGTKRKHMEEAIAATELRLSADDVRYLEELYLPHEVVGALSE
ncbi:MAG: aldo/keto reductase [Candidatus Methanomethylophilaceae archaeon]|nr:aldo/keto reductase [Candidatus Methanomethylophilaceae archaeon]